MKKLTILLLFTAIILTSCGRESVFLTKETPFIVKKIKKKNENCVYTSKGFNEPWKIFCQKAVIIAPCGYFQINDTIKLQRK